MKDKLILIGLSSMYFIIKKRKDFFKYLFIFLILFSLLYLFESIFSRLSYKQKIQKILYFNLIFISSYYLIIDENPFYHLLFFILPFRTFFKGIILIIFVTYFMNKYINTNKKENTFFLDKYVKYIISSKKNLLHFIICSSLIKFAEYIYSLKLWIFIVPKNKALPLDTENHTKFYITAIIFNIEPIAKDWLTQMKYLINYLGKKNVYVSLYENGDSTDNTRNYLKEFEKYLNDNKIINKIDIEKHVYQDNYERIEFLAEIRNRALDFLYEIPNLNFSNTKIIYFNDIIYTYQDIIKLIGTNGGNYDAVCAMDYYDSFYDRWAALDLAGNQFKRQFPYFVSKTAQDAYINGEPVRIFSCWNGVTVLNGKMFKDKLLSFRSGTKLRQSECTLFHADMYWNGFEKSFVNTQIAVTYTYEYYFKNLYLYPWSKNIASYFANYLLSFFADKIYGSVNYKDDKIELKRVYDEVIRLYFTK